MCPSVGLWIFHQQWDIEGGGALDCKRSEQVFVVVAYPRTYIGNSKSFFVVSNGHTWVQFSCPKVFLICLDGMVKPCDSLKVKKSSEDYQSYRKVAPCHQNLVSSI